MCSFYRVYQTIDMMKITLLQSNLVWEGKRENIRSFGQQIKNIDEETDLIILPEMFTTGFSMQPQRWAEPHKGDSFKQMQDWAKSKNAAVYGSFIVEENNTYYNRAYFIFPDGSYKYYDKRHLFRMAKEDLHYSSGQERVVVDYKGWRILLQVCYDLRFPVWSRNNLNFDLIIYVANWPKRRSLPWQILLKARAIENLSYVVGLNRIGNDGNGIEHSGDSALIDFKGEEISHITPSKQMSETIELDQKSLKAFRDKFPAYLDADKFSI